MAIIIISIVLFVGLLMFLVGSFCDFEPHAYLGDPDPNCPMCGGCGLYESAAGKKIDCPCRYHDDFDD